MKNQMILKIRKAEIIPMNSSCQSVILLKSILQLEPNRTLMQYLNNIIQLILLKCSEINDPVLLEIRRERAIELSFEGFSWPDICRWKVGELVTKPWDGIYIPKLDVSYDMNGDGKADVNFTKNLNPEKESGVFYLYVGKTLENGATNNSQLGEDGHRLFFMKHQTRTWDDKLYFYPIPAVDLVKNPNLKQNPGW
ncbi:MAG TPA: RagB/SusD family nutrient uptake outer membrane protein [Sphingobacterium sp.]|nr:RagB/SusD family nutrient uptake outer membrane protein [Sphingobacterium sp.]